MKTTHAEIVSNSQSNKPSAWCNGFLFGQNLA